MNKKAIIILIIIGLGWGAFATVSLFSPLFRTEIVLGADAPAVNNVVEDVADSSPISYNAGTGDNRILVVAIAMAWESDNAIDALAYDGDALTRVGMKEDPWEWGRAELWYLMNPSAGSNNLTITSDDNSVAPMVIAYVSGADTTGLGTGTGNNNDDSDALDVDITPEVADSLLVASFVFGDSGESLSATGGSTLHGQSGATVISGLASKDASGTGSHNIALDATTGDGWAVYAMEIKAAAVAPSDTCTPPASGDWYIHSSDNCYITTDTYINGTTHLLNRGTGGLYIIDGAILYTLKLSSTSTPVYTESDDGSNIGGFIES